MCAREEESYSKRGGTAEAFSVAKKNEGHARRHGGDEKSSQGKIAMEIIIPVVGENN